MGSRKLLLKQKEVAEAFTSGEMHSSVFQPATVALSLVARPFLVGGMRNHPLGTKLSSTTTDNITYSAVIHRLHNLLPSSDVNVAC